MYDELIDLHVWSEGSTDQGKKQTCEDNQIEYAQQVTLVGRQNC